MSRTGRSLLRERPSPSPAKEHKGYLVLFSSPGAQPRGNSPMRKKGLTAYRADLACIASSWLWASDAGAGATNEIPLALNQAWADDLGGPGFEGWGLGAARDVTGWLELPRGSPQKAMPQNLARNSRKLVGPNFAGRCQVGLQAFAERALSDGPLWRQHAVAACDGLCGGDAPKLCLHC